MKTSILLVLVLPTLIFCACTKNVNIEEENKVVVRNWFEEGWNKQNTDIIDKYFAANYVNHGVPTNNVDEWKQVVTSFLTAFPDIHFTVDDQIAEGDKVVTRWTSRATHQGEYMGVPATGKKVTVTGINISRHANGKYVEDWGNWDALGLMEQLQGEQAVADTGSIAAGKFNLRYHIEGTGTPTIVIGFPTYSDRAFSQNLRSYLRLVFLDHRGSAPSPGRVDTTEFALEKLVDDIELARRTLRLGRIAVIGHSGNSFMALEYAKKYPANVSHVIMIGISPDLSAVNDEATEKNWQQLASSERKAIMEENLRRVPDEELAQLPPGQRFIKSYVRNGPRIFYDLRFDASQLLEGSEINMDMFNYVWGEVFRDIDITQGLDTFDRPVFLALGRYDFLVAPPSTWDPIRPEFRDLTMLVFEKSGHFPMLEEQELFDKKLIEWISSQ